jgi:hypothetical protein
MAKRSSATGPSDQVSEEQLRQQFRHLSGQADETAGEFRNRAIAGGAALAVLLLLLIFLFGRSRGKKATTVIEIIRV